MNTEKNMKYTCYIKCKYIIFEKIFPYIPYKNQLLLIKYNKEFQKELYVDINIYKKRSGKYRIIESNGKGKEFILANNKLIFEGEYKNGIKSGKWKEFHECNGKIKFDGEYFQGKKWNGIGYNIQGEKDFEIKDGNGEIKEYYDNGKLKFKCEYKNGCIIGKGEEYHEYNGKIKFEGNYINGKRWKGIGKYFNGAKEYEINNGRGIVYEYHKNGELKYEGEIVNGEKNGKGKDYHYNGDLAYEGEYLNREKSGEGKEYNELGLMLFKGKYKNDKRLKGENFYRESYRRTKRYIFGQKIIKDKMNNKLKKLNGKVKEYFNKDKLKFDGEYLNGKKWNGIGYNQNGEIDYEIKNGNGKIKEYFNYNDSYLEVQYINGEIKGKVKEYCNNKLVFDGEYLNGEGKEFDSNGKLIYEGKYLNGKRNGKGKEYYNNNKIKFDGEFFNGKKWKGIGYNYNGRKVYELKEGKGNIIEYNNEGKIEYEGEYLNGERNGKGKLYDGSFEYIGDFLNDEIIGNIQIFIIFENNSHPFLLFEGLYSNGKKIKGKEYDEKRNLLFNGKYFNNTWWEGEVQLYDFNRHYKRFEGKLLNGKINEKGKEFYEFYTNDMNLELRIKFEGEYLNGKRWNGTGYNFIGEPDFEIQDGNGIIKEYHYINGKKKFECEYSKGRINGNGTEYYKNGNKEFIGEYISEQKDRILLNIYRFLVHNILYSDNFNVKRWNGTGYDFNGKETYKLENGKGIVEIYTEYNDGLSYLDFRGEFLNGEKNGEGSEYYINGKLRFKGEYKDGRQYNGTFYKNDGISIDYELKEGKKIK